MCQCAVVLSFKVILCVYTISTYITRWFHQVDNIPPAVINSFVVVLQTGNTLIYINNTHTLKLTTPHDSKKQIVFGILNFRG